MYQMVNFCGLCRCEGSFARSPKGSGKYAKAEHPSRLRMERKSQARSRIERPRLRSIR